MSTRRWFSLAVGAVAAVSVISAGATALAATQPTPGRHVHTNYRGNVGAAARGPARAARPAAGTVTHHLSLAASAFTPDGLHDTTMDYFNQWDPTTLSNKDAGRCFNTGLSLPPNVTLKSVKAYYTAGSASMYFEVNRQDLANHTETVLVSTDTTIVSTPAYTSTTLNFPASTAVVNMTSDAYSVGVCPNGSTTFSGLTITYTQPAS